MHFLENVKLYNRYSQYAEDSLIEAIFNKIGTASKWCVECGASDGLFFSNTRKLIEEGWSSIQIEADFEQYKKLSDRYLNWANGMTVFCEYAHLGAAPQQTFDGVFAKYQTLPKDFDLLVIDVDGQDYHLWNQLLTYHPRVVICEYDPNADQDFIPEIDGPGQAGMRAIHHVALARGYQVVCATQCNLICVRNDLMELLTEQQGEMPSYEGHGQIWSGQPDFPSVHLDPAKPQAAAQANGNGHGKELKIGAAMSTPRFGPLSTFDCIMQALAQFGIPLFRGEGAFWHHSLSRSIQKVIDFKGEYVLTIDYDTIFNASPTNSDIAKLAVLMYDNPDVDVIVPFQMRREGGPLLANTGGAEVRISDKLIPIDQGHFGLTLFRVSVFERIGKPWFREKPNDSGDWEENRIDSDIGFWINCKENGVRVALSTDVIIGHGEYVVTWPDEAIKPHYQPLNAWRNTGAKPPEAFDREKFVQAAIEGRAKMEVKLDMGE